MKNYLVVLFIFSLFFPITAFAGQVKNPRGGTEGVVSSGAILSESGRSVAILMGENKITSSASDDADELGNMVRGIRNLLMISWLMYSIVGIIILSIVFWTLRRGQQEIISKNEESGGKM